MFACGGTELKLFTINGPTINQLSVYNKSFETNAKLTNISWCNNDNSYLAVMQENQPPQIINVEDCTKPSLLYALNGLEDITAVAFQRNSKSSLGIGSKNGAVAILDLMSHVTTKIYPVLRHSIAELQFNCDDSLLGVLCDEFLVIFTDETNFIELKYDSKCTAIQFLPSCCNYVAVGCKNGEISLLDAENSTKISSFDNHSAQITSIALTTDGKSLITSSLDRKIIISDTNSCVSWTINNSHAVTALDLSPDDRFIAAGTEDGHIYVYDIRNYLNPLTFARIQNNAVNKIVFDGVTRQTDILFDMNFGDSIKSFNSIESETIFSKHDIDSEQFDDLLDKNHDGFIDKMKMDLMKNLTTNLNSLEKLFMKNCRKFEYYFINEFGKQSRCLNYENLGETSNNSETTTMESFSKTNWTVDFI